MKTIKIKVHGSVQGIGFRNFAKGEADRLEIKGHIRNMEDGSVEVIAEGRDERVNDFIEICKKGPRFGNIRGVEVKDITHQGFKDFRIIRI